MTLNHASAQMYIDPSALAWTVTALLALPLLLALCHIALTRWGGGTRRPVPAGTALFFRQPGDAPLTPGQRCARWYFAAALILLGVAALPVAIPPEWSRHLASAGVLAAVLAAGIFLSPLISRREPRGQGAAAYALLGVLAVVLYGAIGAGGLRLWPPLLLAALTAWTVLLWRGLRYRLINSRDRALPWLFFLAALTVPLTYATALVWPGGLTGDPLSWPGDAFAAGEAVRSGFAHSWPENILSPFVTALVACLLVLLGAVRERIAVVASASSVALYLASSAVSVADQLFGGTSTAAANLPGAAASGTAGAATGAAATPFGTDAAMACDAVLTTLAAVPLAVLAVAAWRFPRRAALHAARSRTRFPHRTALLFLAAAGCWNLLGAGVFGFAFGLPIIARSGVGPALATAQAQATAIGTYGMLACALTLCCARYMIPDAKWPNRLATLSFWSLNLGLAWTVFAARLPLGLLHLFHPRPGPNPGAEPGYSAMEWLSLPGWILYLAGGIAPLLWIVCLALEQRGTGGADRAEESKAGGPDWDIPAPDLVTTIRAGIHTPHSSGLRRCPACRSTSPNR
ncbi:hypothetical protein JK358_24450 [Nocardia sp. 2]|uniref:Uncharacterized protein n=1 Tax=Nocardia acididurans TaxID=2802282 RepID=A0ABS1MAG9_9NOCA|nr:hypothetical protein [Nocardia acididurans]MBL1077561.1 hypothetical protein [Nocardia acididurans]